MYRHCLNIHLSLSIFAAEVRSDDAAAAGIAGGVVGGLVGIVLIAVIVILIVIIVRTSKSHHDTVCLSCVCVLYHNYWCPTIEM